MKFYEVDDSLNDDYYSNAEHESTSLMKIEDSLDDYYYLTVEHKLTPLMKDVLFNYSDKKCDNISSYLLHKKKYNGDDVDAIKRNIEVMRKAIKLSKLSIPITVYHGTTSKVLSKSNDIKIKTFLSTTLDYDTAKEFSFDFQSSGIVLEIHLPVGYPALWMGNLSLYPREQELLLLNNSRFTVTDQNIKHSIKNYILEPK